MDDAVRRQVTIHWLLVLAAASLVFLTNLGGPGLWDEDEPKNATCAQEMLARGDWVVPTFNEQLRTDKPILIYWLLLSVYSLFGVSELTARLPSALLSLGTVLMTYEIGRVLYRPQVGLWGALVLSASMMFAVAARACTPDGTLIFCTTLGMLCFARGVAALPETPALQLSSLRLGLPTIVAFYAALGLAVLAKGPAGVVLPTAVAVTFWIVWPLSGMHTIERTTTWSAWLREQGRLLLATLAPRGVIRAIWSMRPLTAFLVVGLIALPWYATVWQATQGEWVRGFLGKHNVARFTTPLEGHSGPIFYYVVSIFVSMLPWSLLLPLALARASQTLRANPFTGRSDALLLTWAGTYVVFFSFAQTKLPSYVLPCYPALGLLVGRIVAEWIDSPALLPSRVVERVLYISASGGLLFCAVLPFIAPIFLPGETAWYSIAGLIPFTAGVLAIRSLHCGQTARAAGCFLSGSLLFATTLFGGVALAVDRHQNSEPILTLIRHQSGDQFQLASFDFFRPSLVFYARKQIPSLADAKAVHDFLLASPHHYLVTRDDQLEKVQGALPPGVTVIDQRRMFLRRRHDVLLIGRNPEQIAAMESATATR